MTAAKEAIPLLVAQTIKEVHGKTKFQKLVFLVQVKLSDDLAPGRLPFQYGLYKFGPFSMDLAATIDDLSRNGSLDHGIDVTPTGRTLHKFRITAKGNQLATELSTADPWLSSHLGAIRELVLSYRFLDLPQLISVAYEMANSRPETLQLGRIGEPRSSG